MCIRSILLRASFPATTQSKLAAIRSRIRSISIGAFDSHTEALLRLHLEDFVAEVDLGEAVLIVFISSGVLRGGTYFVFVSLVLLCNAIFGGSLVRASLSVTSTLNFLLLVVPLGCVTFSGRLRRRGRTQVVHIDFVKNVFPEDKSNWLVLRWKDGLAS